MAHTILVVDDDEGIRESLRMILEEEGYAVQTAVNGRQAVELMGRERPCFVVLDLMMPVMDGWEVAGWMREHREVASVPVCVVTAMPDMAPSDTACVLRKPINLGQLLAVIEASCQTVH